MKQISEQLKAYLELAEKATPGPWYTEGSEVRYDCSPYTTEEGIADCTVQICDLYRPAELSDTKMYDREFIAASRTMGPALAKALIRAMEELECVRSFFDVDRNKYARQEIVKALADIDKILGEAE